MPKKLSGMPQGGSPKVAGLLNRGRDGAENPNMMASGQAPPPEAQGGDSAKQVEEFVLHAMNVIHSDKTRDSILSGLQSGKVAPAFVKMPEVQQEHMPNGQPDGPLVVASTVLMIYNNLLQQAEGSGAKVPFEVQLQGATDIITEIITLGEKSGAIQPMDENQQKQTAQLAVSGYIKDGIDSGRITPEQLIQWKEQLKQSGQVTPELEQQIQQGMNQPSGQGTAQPNKPAAPQPKMGGLLGSRMATAGM